MKHGQPLIVVGGGITGLAAAFRLQQAGHAVLVLEASNDVGGRVCTLSRDGFRLDVGAAVFPSSYHQLLRLVDDAGLSGSVAPTSDLTGMLRAGRVHRSRSSSKLDALRSGMISWGSKAVLMRAVLDARRAGERLSWQNLSLAAEFDGESAAAYARRRLNDELLSVVVGPVCRTFCLAPPEQVSAVNFLFSLRHFAGVSMWNSATGVDFLPRGLAKQLDVQLNAPVHSVRETATGVNVTWTDGGTQRTEHVAGCVIALPAAQMAQLHPDLSAVRRELAEGIVHARSVAVHLGLSRRPADEDATLLQLAMGEHPDFVGIVLDHNKAPGRAPPGKGLITTLWTHEWGCRQWERDDDAIAAEATATVARFFPSLVADVAFAHVQRWRFGPDIPRPGLHRAMQRFHAEHAATSRIQIAGDYFAATSTNAAVTSAERAARELSALLH